MYKYLGGNILEIIYNILWIFFIYGFLGWCMEVVYAAIETGKFVNRGFLAGPLCPIYGIGILIVVWVLKPVENSVFLLFTGALVLTSILEFITGFLLERFFNDKWWDYSDLPFNIKGYICLKFSIAWGLICVFIVRLVYPITDKLISVIPRDVGIGVLGLSIAVFITDFVITLINVIKLPKRMKAITDAENALEKLSSKIGNGLAENTINIQEKSSEIKNGIVEKGTELKNELLEKGSKLKTGITERGSAIKNGLSEKAVEMEELKKKYVALLNEKNLVHKRLAKAFPNIQNGKYKDIFLKIKNLTSEKRK